MSLGPPDARGWPAIVVAARHERLVQAGCREAPLFWILTHRRWKRDLKLYGDLWLTPNPLSGSWHCIAGQRNQFASECNEDGRIFGGER